jgi:HAD superfamily hydrolase (TIGR01459 family)
LWEDVNKGRLKIDKKQPKKIFSICGQKNDPVEWAGDSRTIEITFELDKTVDVIMLMGIQDGTAPDAFDAVFKQAREFQIPLVCSNPDKTSPRAGGLVISPGALAQRYADMGGEVIWYGKPHLPIFQAVSRSFPELPANRFLIVGDSLEHDIAGAQKAGMQSAFVRGGIHASEFSNAKNNDELLQVTDRLVVQHGLSVPSYILEFLA